jgi:EmrB/QacA subfamily drug resistance transporter
MTEAVAGRSSTEPANPLGSRWIALALLAGAQLMLVLDVTVVSVALPDIGRSLHLSRGELPWTMTTYTTCFGGLILLGGRIADVAGPRRTTLVGLVVFTASSLICGLAGDAATLLVGRALQGVGAAIMSPAALATVMVMFPGPARTRAVAVWSSISGVGSALGVVLGGVLTSAAGWRWVFTINVPIGALLLVAIPAVTVERTQRSAGRQSVDATGAALVTAGTGAIIYSLVNAGPHGWSAPATVVSLLIGSCLWAVLALVERRAAAPLLSIQLLTRRPSLAGSFLMLVGTGLLVGGFFLGSFALQHRDGYSAVHVGLMFLPVAVATVAGAHLAGRLLARLDARSMAVAGLATATGGYLVPATVAGPAATAIGLTVAALGIGAVFVTAFTAALADAPDREAGLRSALVNTFHELGGAAGIAVLSTAAGSALVAVHPTSTGFETAFRAGAVAAGAGVAVAALVVPRALRRPTQGHLH